jgi:aspartyl-tRNA(Asn)/glutamyl-tRNA(Gln) amidotransferase subunit B
VLPALRPASEYYETVARSRAIRKIAANRVMGDLMALLKAEGKEIAASPVGSEKLGELVKLIGIYRSKS